MFTHTLCKQKVPEGDKVGEAALSWEWWAKHGHTLSSVHHYSVALGYVTIRHQSKDVVKVRLHAVGVKVHDGRSVGILRVLVVVHKDDDHYVIANVTLSFQLQGENR